MTDDACEAGYRGVVREGKEGTREGLKKMFVEFPENRAEILQGLNLAPMSCCTKGLALQGVRTVRCHVCLQLRGRQVRPRGVHPLMADRHLEPDTPSCALAGVICLDRGQCGQAKVVVARYPKGARARR
jgi:hypothetical protein